MNARCLVALTALAGLALAGCSFSVGSSTPTVKEADLERSVTSTLTDKIGQAPQNVDCPDDLEGKVGAVLNCTLSIDGTARTMTVTVTSVEGEKVNFDIAVDAA